MHNRDKLAEIFITIGCFEVNTIHNNYTYDGEGPAMYLYDANISIGVN